MRMRLWLWFVICLLPVDAWAQLLPTPFNYSNPQTVNAQDAGTACSVTGSCAVFNLAGAPGAMIDLTAAATWSGTLTFEAQANGTTPWRTLSVFSIATNAQVTTATAAGSFSISGSGWSAVRVRATTYSSGALTVVGTRAEVPAASAAAGSVTGTVAITATNGDPLAASGTALTVAIPAGSGPVQLQDGSGNAINSTSNALNVNCSNCLAGQTSAPSGASVSGLVTRPYLSTDGTNTTPAMDAVARTGYQRINDGTNSEVIDPCNSSGATISSIPISIAGTAVVKAGTSAKKTYICGVFILPGAAENFSFIAGTGSTCGTNTVAVIGSTTAAAGMITVASGGFVLPVSDKYWAATTVNADDLCIIQAGSVRLAGVMKVAVQ